MSGRRRTPVPELDLFGEPVREPSPRARRGSVADALGAPEPRASRAEASALPTVAAYGATPTEAALLAAAEAHLESVGIDAASSYAPEAPPTDDVPGASPASAIPVAALTQAAKEVVEGAFIPLWVRGEVSDFKAHRNGHWYFTLRDATAQVRCVLWGRDARRLPAPPDDGMQVVALGQMTVYPARADLQLVVRTLDAVGDGLWRKALDQARAALAADGLLDPARRRALPRYPRRVAVITSPDGAALHDIRAVLRRRWPAAELVVVAARVQGDGAPAELCAALARALRWRHADGAGFDVLIIGRGGGSREDLWAFNDEALARAVAVSPIPIVSAVGHEVDVTLCDLVADLRAPTPSAAAEAVVPVMADVAAEVEALGGALVSAVARRIADARATAESAGAAVAAAAARVVERRRAAVDADAGRLHALSPLATLGRGYAVARDAATGVTLARVADFAPGRAFELLVRDGRVRAITAPADGPVTNTPAPDVPPPRAQLRPVTFEETLDRLHAILADLEGDDLELDRALALFEEGVDRLRAANGELARAEARVQQLVEEAGGALALAAFER